MFFMVWWFVEVWFLLVKSNFDVPLFQGNLHFLLETVHLKSQDSFEGPDILPKFNGVNSFEMFPEILQLWADRWVTKVDNILTSKGNVVQQIFQFSKLLF
jgi:hypothetical protein